MRTTQRQHAYFQVDDARREQEQKHPLDHIAVPFRSNDARLRTLVEEVGEVARAIQDLEEENLPLPDREARKLQLRHELAQVGACAVGWIEALFVEDRGR